MYRSESVYFLALSRSMEEGQLLILPVLLAWSLLGAQLLVLNGLLSRLHAHAPALPPAPWHELTSEWSAYE